MTGYFFLNVVFPDISFDTLAYSYLIQESSFTNPASTGLHFNDKSYLFALGERIIYYCRNIFGVRLSVILNLFVFIISYFMIKEILKCLISKYIKNYSNKVIEIICSISGFCIMMTEFLYLGLFIMKPDLFIISFVIYII